LFLQRPADRPFGAGGAGGFRAFHTQPPSVIKPWVVGSMPTALSILGAIPWPGKTFRKDRMNALALMMGLALGPEGLEEDRLPRSLSEFTLPPATASADEEPTVWVGLRLGAADAIDGDRPGFLVGFEWRIHILTWLGVEGGVDFLSKEEIDSITG